MAEYAFVEHDMRTDWRFSFKVHGTPSWSPADEVWLSLTPDFAMWDDYGLRTRGPVPGSTGSPWFQTHSGDGTGQVTLASGGTVDALIPWNQMQAMGPGAVNVAFQLRSTADQSRTGLLHGRLMLLSTGG
jgi:hypothetical protein